jgi:prophage regulatory protein
VALILGRSSSGVDKLRVRDPDFPKPLKSSENRRSRVYFVRSEIEAYLQSKLDARVAA